MNKVRPSNHLRKNTGNTIYPNQFVNKLQLWLFASLLTFFSSSAIGENLFVSLGDGTIKKITPDGTVSTFAPSIGLGYQGLAFDNNGNLFSANFTGSITKITPDGSMTQFVSGLQNPVSLAFDTAGNLFSANKGDGTISKITPDGTVTTFAPSIGLGYQALDFDSSGFLFSGNAIGTISKIAPDGNMTQFVSGLNNPFDIAFEVIPEPAGFLIFGLATVCLLTSKERKDC